MRWATALLMTALFFGVACAPRRVAMYKDAQGGTQIVVNDRYNDILQSDLPADVKERALKDLIIQEEKERKSILDWVIQAVTLGASIYAGVRVSK